MVLWEFWSEKQTASAFCQNYTVSTVLAHGSLGLLTYTIKDNLLVECIDIGAIWRQYFFMLSINFWCTLFCSQGRRDILRGRYDFCPHLLFLDALNPCFRGGGADYTHRIGFNPLDLNMFRRACAVIM